MKNLWEGNNLWKSFPRRSGWIRREKLEVLRGLSLVIPAGEILALVGPSGSGKSTLARLMLGLDKPDRGELLLHGRAYREWKDPKSFYRRIQMVFQATLESADPQWTAGRVIAEPLLYLRPEWSKEERQRRILQLTDEVHLPQRLLEKPMAVLSGGENRRVCLARALAVEPLLIVLDEPTTGLDAPLQREILLLLEELARQHQTSLLLITHDRDAAAAIAHRTLTLKDGSLLDYDRGDVVS
jgi:ABC-type dipeptide/oligopeptide/nickel transport system ATPase subunit